MWNVLGGFFVIFTFIALIIFFIFLFVRRGRIKAELKVFFEKHHFVQPNTLPTAIMSFVKSNYHSYTIYQGMINKNGEQFPFFWIYGFPKPTLLSSRTNTYVEPYLLLFFPPYTLSKEFFSVVGETLKPPTFKEILVTWDVDHPIDVKLLPDKFFMVKWQSLHTVKSFEKKLFWLYENIS